MRDLRDRETGMVRQDGYRIHGLGQQVRMRADARNHTILWNCPLSGDFHVLDPGGNDHHLAVKETKVHDLGRDFAVFSQPESHPGGILRLYAVAMVVHLGNEIASRGNNIIGIRGGRVGTRARNVGADEAKERHAVGAGRGDAETDPMARPESGALITLGEGWTWATVIVQGL